MNRQDILVRNIKNLMIERKIGSANEFAKKIGMAQSGMRSILRKESLPTLKTLFSICDTFNVPMAYLFEADPKQFGELVNVEEGNKDALISMLNEQLRQRNNEIEELSEKNEKLNNHIKNTTEKFKRLSEDGDDRIKLVVSKERNYLECGSVTMPVDEVDVEQIAYSRTKNKFEACLQVYVDEITTKK